MGGSIVSGISQCVTIRSDVPETSNFGLRTPVRLARPASLARLSCGGESPLIPDVQAIEVLLYRNGFSAAC
jgi:hypothetical protein